MTSPDGPEQSSMEDILASIRKIIATEPASETQPSGAAIPPSAKLNGNARKGSALPIGTELPRSARDEEGKTFFTPLPERVSPLFRRPSEAGSAKPEGPAVTDAAPVPVEHDLADLLEDFGASALPADAAADTSKAVSEPAAVPPAEQTSDRLGTTTEAPKPSAGLGMPEIDFSVLATASSPQSEYPPLDQPVTPAKPLAPPASPAAAIGRALSEGNEFMELPPWAVAAAAGARRPLEQQPHGTSQALLEFNDGPTDADSDPLTAAIARVASAIAPSDDFASEQAAAEPEVKPAPTPAQAPAADESDPIAAANSALNDLAAGLAASTARRAEPPPRPALSPVAPALPPAAPIPLVAPEAVFEDAVSKLVKPMLEKWLADNMPRIIENALRAEVGETTKKPRL